jgi:hypothetical protein
LWKPTRPSASCSRKTVLVSCVRLCACRPVTSTSAVCVRTHAAQRRHTPFGAATSADCGAEDRGRAGGLSGDGEESSVCDMHRFGARCNHLSLSVRVLLICYSVIILFFLFICLVGYFLPIHFLVSCAAFCVLFPLLLKSSSLFAHCVPLPLQQAQGDAHWSPRRGQGGYGEPCGGPQPGN